MLFEIFTHERHNVDLFSKAGIPGICLGDAILLVHSRDGKLGLGHTQGRLARSQAPGITI